MQKQILMDEIIMERKTIYFLLLSVFALFFSCNNKNGDAEELFEQGKTLVVKEKEWNEGGEALLKSLALQDESKPSSMLSATYYYLSIVYWQQDFTDKALTYAQKALKCSTELPDDSLHMKILNRLASCYYLSDKYDSAYYYYNKVLDIALEKKDSIMILNAYNNIGAVKISSLEFNEALDIFDKGALYSPHRRKDEHTYHYNRSRCYEYLKEWNKCIAEIRECMTFQDSTDVEAQEKLYRRLYKAEKNSGRFEVACLSADSSYLLADSVFRMKRREELKGITEKYQQEKYESELELQRSHWLLAIADIVFVFVFVIFFIMYRNKRRMINLQRRMEALKIQVVREEQKRDNQEENTWNEEKEENLEHLYLEQFVISRDIFRSRPAYNKLRQLKYHTDKNYLSDEERMPIIDSVLEIFIDHLQKLRVNYPELTEDECIYAVLIFLGCNNATASILTKTSEATLRKRRSRFKQKTSEQVFNCLFG